jgi:hypothetical protein
MFYIYKKKTEKIDWPTDRTFCLLFLFFFIYFFLLLLSHSLLLISFIGLSISDVC